jgi:hypothetical protein
MRRQFWFWVGLALGVCVTQIIFVEAQTKATDIGVLGVWVFAIARAIFTLLADGYTAFAHEEKPTTEERDLEEQEHRAKHADALLHQKQHTITMINDGILAVREAHTEAEIKNDKLQTRLRIERLQNKAQVETLETQAKQAQMFEKMGQSFLRAIFDPDMDNDKRQIMLNNMGALTEAMKQLSEPSRVVEIREEDE